MQWNKILCYEQCCFPLTQHQCSWACRQLVHSNAHQSFLHYISSVCSLVEPTHLQHLCLLLPRAACCMLEAGAHPSFQHLPMEHELWLVFGLCSWNFTFSISLPWLWQCSYSPCWFLLRPNQSKHKLSCYTEYKSAAGKSSDFQVMLKQCELVSRKLLCIKRCDSVHLYLVPLIDIEELLSQYFLKANNKRLTWTWWF